MTGASYQPRLADLRAVDGEQSAFHERAAALARARFGRRVFVRAVVEISNFCRENCHYCGMRRDNRGLDRYRASRDALAELLLHHLPMCVTDVNLQGGEDPVAVREVAVPLLRWLRERTSLGLSVCLGTLDHDLYAGLRAAGAELYILKFESAYAQTYELLESPGTLHERLAHLRQLASAGWFLSSGFIAGLPGEVGKDWLASCRLAASLPLHGCSVSPFIPGESTPLARAAGGEVNTALNCMAALRLMRPDWVIPAVSALNIGQPDCGYRRGLRTGANLVTINLTPPDLRQDYLLYKRDRVIMTEERILRAIEAEDLQPSTTGLVQHLRAQTGCRERELSPA